MAGFVPTREGWRQRLIALAILCVVLPALGALGRLHWTLDLLSHFRLQYFTGLLACAAAFALLGKRRHAAVFLAASAVLAAPFIGWFIPVSPPSARDSLKVIAFNVNTANDRHPDVAEFLAEEDAEIVLLQEVDEQWLRSLQALEHVYPHRFGVARSDNFGIVVLSKRPLLAPQVHTFSEFEVPWLSWGFEIDSVLIRFAGVHTLPPISRENATLRNTQLDAILAWVNDGPETATVVMGDLNATVFCPWLRMFLKNSNLRDTAKGFGLWPTWMAGFPPFAIPIDQVFVTSNLGAIDRRLGPSLGSDHRPIIVEIALLPNP